ncbi:MAG: TIGR03960 family B12-binding radical SAM protein, partial [Candidatus Hydrogenedens sp.]
TDLEQILRQKNYPLFLWESKDPIKQSDWVGITLQSELTYTTVLNILDLAHIPLYAKDRTNEDPLICAGGPCCFNPEPMAPFMDFFVIGEGEDIILEIAEILLTNKDASRDKKLALLSRIDGIYVPDTIPLTSNQHGVPIPDASTRKVRRAITKELTTKNFVGKYIVPFASLIHDGLSIEVMRGCTRGCRFCLAGCTFRPVRERSPEEVSTLLASFLPDTGLETVTLVSLSTCDHSQIQDLLHQTRQITQPSMTGISLPSLRLDSFSVKLADSISAIRRSGLTFAPEAGSERLRKMINKSVTDEDLMEIIRIAFQKGWTHVKLYFMIGLPTETEEDLNALINLSIQCLNIAKKIRHSAHIHLGISTFVPKPWTPFQWANQISLEETTEKQKKILSGLKKYKAIKINFHTPDASFIEGLLSRADRRISPVILSAWQEGAKLETSTDKISIQHWLHALEKHNLMGENFLRERNEDEAFPWDFIDTGIKKDWLYKEWQNAHQYKITSDCREKGCLQCGIQQREGFHCIHWKKEKKESIIEIETSSSHLPPVSTSHHPIQRLLLKVGKVGLSRFLSHLEFQTAWIRALRRTQLPLAYTQGYHAHARISIALPAPVGEILLEEYIEIWLQTEKDTDELQKRIQSALPTGFLLYTVESIPISSPSIMERVAGLHYAVIIQTEKSNNIEDMEELKIFIHSQLEEIAQGKTSALNPFPVEIRTENNSILLQWQTPIIKGKFFKPKTLREYLLKNKFPIKNFQSIRIKTFLDSLPDTFTPLPLK